VEAGEPGKTKRAVEAEMAEDSEESKVSGQAEVEVKGSSPREGVLPHDKE